jgi:hypothetical protein
MNPFLHTLRQVKPRDAAQLGAAHLLLAVGSLSGGLPYLVLQGLLGTELLLTNATTAVLYPQRGLLRHGWDLLKLAGVLVFVLFFLTVTYGVAAGRHGEAALPLALDSLRDVDPLAIAWAAAYIAGSLGVGLWQALRSTDPRLAWTKSQLGRGGATFVAMFFMVFVAIFAGRPLLGFARAAGVPLDTDALLGVLMVAVRYVTALIVSTFSEADWKELAAEPYADGRP